MIGKLSKGKVFVFIDAANILYSQKTLGWRVDYQKLKKYLARECDLKSIFFYTGRVGSLAKQNKFLQKLSKLGYKVYSKEVKFIKVAKDKSVPKGNLDVELAVDMVTRYDEYETAVLFSGDGDFAYAVDYIKKKGKRIIVVSTRGHIARELLKRAKYLDLRKLKNEITLKRNEDKKSGDTLSSTPEV